MGPLSALDRLCKESQGICRLGEQRRLSARAVGEFSLDLDASPATKTRLSLTVSDKTDLHMPVTSKTHPRTADDVVYYHSFGAHLQFMHPASIA